MGPPQGGLLAQTKSLDQRLVCVVVRSCEVPQVTITFAHKLQEAKPCGVVLLIDLEVLGDLLNPCGQEGNLHSGEPVSVSPRR